MFPKAAGEPIWRDLLAEQFRQNGPLFFNLGFGILRNVAAAEDVCQQGMLKALERPHEIREVTALRAWLMQIIVNESLSLLRRKKLENDALPTQLAITKSDPAPAGLHLEMRESVLTAMERLPERTRLIVAMRVMQEMSGNQVKQLLGCSAKEVSVHLHSGMEMLRGTLIDWKTR